MMQRRKAKALAGRVQATEVDAEAAEAWADDAKARAWDAAKMKKIAWGMGLRQWAKAAEASAEASEEARAAIWIAKEARAKEKVK